MHMRTVVVCTGGGTDYQAVCQIGYPVVLVIDIEILAAL